MPVLVMTKISGGVRIRTILKKAVSAAGRRYLRGSTLGNLGFCTSWAVDRGGMGPEWIEVVHQDLHIKRLGSRFRGKKIVHVSDLHCSRTVTGRYLKHCIDRINDLQPDIVVLTGDYITYDLRGRFTEKVVGLIGRINSRLGTYACLGNHDYGVDGMPGQPRHGRAELITEGLQDLGVTVLRNQSAVLEFAGQNLWLVGLGDLWAGDHFPEKAFADVDEDGAVITLTHNPESIEHLDDFNIDAVMSGHTHGIELQFAARTGWPIWDKCDYHSGLYNINGKKLYVNRGLGRHGKAFFNTRPEITVFNLV